MDKSPPKIMISRFTSAEHVRNTWQVMAEPGMAPEDLLDPNAWGNVAEQLKPFDLIAAHADDSTWWAEYLVTDVGRLHARVHLLRKADWGRAPASEAVTRQDEYDVKHRGIRKWSVLRKADNAVLRDGYATREEAEAYLVSHVRSATE